MKSKNLSPGDKVLVDQLESTTPGLVDNFKGKPSSAKYHAASVYVDHASHYIFVKCHYSTGTQEAVEGKQLFERQAALQGVTVKFYRADNRIMSCNDYVQHAHINQQAITHCGFNAHGQNGIAERSIRTLCDHARTMLLHAMEHWPDVVTLDLWPFALRMAADIHNATPGRLQRRSSPGRKAGWTDYLIFTHSVVPCLYWIHPCSRVIRYPNGNRDPTRQYTLVAAPDMPRQSLSSSI
jgi:hypothetical protein